MQEGYQGDIHTMPRCHKCCPLLLSVGCFTVRMCGSCYTVYPGLNTTFSTEGEILGQEPGGGRRGYQPMAPPAYVTGFCTSVLAQMAEIAVMHNLIQKSH